MSTKSTIILSDANEHWYHDCIDDTITLEIGREHAIEIDEEGTFVTIKKGTALFNAISRKRWWP